ncbi:hypothetical protein [Thermofilum pendens]|uniref:Uncharacterized protein n=1 Tax=Thermofilum pendens (strain DSM 2475 / Hrk 5) TaxID=368408 RepID=A1RYI9_THEPD|nr:hypothetical protein [Thermofilum pendens]ABL78269.1 hypothetical protein Tpen_0868 [Thermofilum pendens Hrk 5]
MNAKVVLVALLSVLAIALYWSPYPLIVGGYVLGGYPWLAPDGQPRSTMIALGVIFSVAFLSATAAMYVLAKKNEELGEEPATPVEQPRGAPSVTQEEEW